MKHLALVLFSAAACTAAQQTTPATSVGPPEASGRVIGHVFCSDTGKPARFASIQLLSEQSARDSSQQAGALIAGIAGSSQGKEGVDFGKLITQGMRAMMNGSNLTAMTDLDGSFMLDKIPPGTYYLIPQYAGYLSPIGQLTMQERMTAGTTTLEAVESKAQKVVVTSGSTANLDVQLERGAAIGGTIGYDDGSPAPGVTPGLMLLDKDGKWKDLPPSSITPMVTDDEGHYRISGLPAGKYAVKAALPTTAASMGIGLRGISMHMNLGDALVVYSGGAVWMKNIKPVEVGAGDSRNDVDVTFPIDGLHVISGTVVAKSDQHPVNSGMVELQDPSDKTIKLRTTMIGKDGSFQFNYVPDGSYRLEVTTAGDMPIDGSGGSDQGNPLAMLLNGSKPSKVYGGTGMTITLPGNSEGLTLQVPDIKSGDGKAN